jgi:hypothetical protein
MSIEVLSQYNTTEYILDNLLTQIFRSAVIGSFVVFDKLVRMLLWLNCSLYWPLILGLGHFVRLCWSR